METELIIDGMTFTSQADGSESSIALDLAVFSARRAKHIAPYILVHEVDANTALKLGWQHGPQGLGEWTDGSADLFDSSGAISSGLHSGGATEVLEADQIRPVVKVVATSGTDRVQLRLSVWMVKKPF